MSIDLGGLFGGGVAAAGGVAAVTQLQDMLRDLGIDASQGATRIANQAMQDTQFRPYTVSSNLANVGVNAQGGFDLNLSKEQQDMQNSLLRQAGAQFGQVGQGMTREERDAQRSRFSEAESMFDRAYGDPTKLTNDYYQNIRAAQRPEEQRQRMNLDQSLFSSGRGGISTAEFGGTAEEFGYEKARAEAGLQASAMARQAALGEQQQALGMGQQLAQQAYQGQQAAQTRDAQALALGSGLTSQGYMPQQQALSMFGASQIPAQLAQQAQMGGAELRAQLEQSGLEGLLSAGVSEATSTSALYKSIIDALSSGASSLFSD
tara:strand:- start:5192 stop:6148 length:957 start_codon:yes stop_codon:yes gene_type:complete